MAKPVSIFIMDVTNSTKNWNEIVKYLEEVETIIKGWTRGFPSVKVKHRLGDEIVCMMDHFSSAYIVAFYISQIWKYKKQPPYFGLTFGMVEDDFSSIDIDKWNHPIMRQARLANETIKQATNRRSMFLMPELAHQESTSIEMINLLLEYQHKMMSEQTDIQRSISRLYSILEEQKAIASIVKKSPSTISSHYKKGNCEIILKTKRTIQHTLNQLEQDSSGNVPHHITKELTTTIKKQLQKNIELI
ncbi:hypothetical protein [Sutcliffiella rhizosphaerae]|uniref:Uncharacterized protein n=1 Tax=Sutcliffiella rhizosphaerae TaxID=2880967 RepID=A0ABM8YUP7_9BACI|nr:hypothetical protein [Sutcliffiella rhizosphaerae]CAG9623706.1 hypothetical protein BACCIP111883_04538 [Sutcliffiella rhizosphaerae]